MSTILDALRKVERERDESPDHAIEPQPLAPDVRRRRNGPLTAIALCAVLGFAGGAVLSWWTAAEEPAVEIAALPVPPPPPAIAVPRAPVPEPAVPMPAAPAPVAVPEQVPNAAAPPTLGEPAAIQAPAVVAIEKSAELPAGGVAAPAPAEGHAGPKDTLASLGKEGTALEPSPFAAQRNAPRDVAPALAPPEKIPGGNQPADSETSKSERELAAVAPSDPAIPEPAPIDVVPEADPEPETPAETLVDTGRSPPGAPKVALSFLQWSADPARRFAFISIDGQPSQRVREGESAAGMTVAAITPNGVQFKREGTSFVIRPRH